MAWFDSHVHLDAAEFAPDRDAVLARARDAGVVGLLLPAIDLASCMEIRRMCDSSIALHPAYGLHPMFLSRHRAEHLDALVTLLRLQRPVALGECGLDFSVSDADPGTQREFFEAQLRIARDFDLPLVIHARRAVQEVTEAIRRIGGLRGVVHSFSGSFEQARQLWELDFRIGIGGPVTYPRAQRLRKIIATMPLEHLLLETDAPDQPLQGNQGQRNEPACVVRVGLTVAELRGVDAHAIALATTANARRLFGLAADAA